jgi:hypothetical protein
MTTPSNLPDLLSPELIFDRWQEYLRGRELDLSHATAQSHDRWSLAMAALRFKPSKAVLIKEISDIKKLEANCVCFADRLCDVLQAFSLCYDDWRE